MAQPQKIFAHKSENEDFWEFSMSKSQSKVKDSVSYWGFLRKYEYNAKFLPDGKGNTVQEKGKF